MRIPRWPAAATALLLIAAAGCTRRAAAAEPATLTPAELAALLQKPAAQRPLVIQVGFEMMFKQAHVPGAEYLGPGMNPGALGRLRERLAPLKRDTAVVLYCGCCPWDRCPNIRPAAKLLDEMGFKNAKLLVIPHDFGRDWVDKGYPVEKGA